MASPSENIRNGKALALGRKVFHFNDQPALTCQSNQDSKEMYTHLVDVLKQDIPNLFGAFPNLQKLAKKISFLTKQTYKVSWMAKYGCAILIRDFDVSLCSTAVIGLDRWESKVHSSVGKGREVTAEADVGSPAIFPAGTIPRKSVEQLLSTVEEQLQKAHQTQRNDQKHHWTPSFVWARLLDSLVQIGAMSSVQAKECYQGGSTDVGLHTGCLRRNTAFPVVLSVCSAMLWYNGDDDHSEFYQLLVVYYLHHLRHQVEDMAKFEPRKIDGGIIVVREIERCLQFVNDDGFQASVVAKMKVHHYQLQCLKPGIDSWPCNTPTIASVENECKQIKPSSFPDVSKATPPAEDIDFGIALARKGAQKNLNWTNLEQYDPSKASTQDAWVALGRLNKAFWQYAKDLHNPRLSHCIQNMRKLLVQHSSAIRIAKQASSHQVHVMSVDLQSCEMLAVWITYCWAHRRATEAHSFFRDYGSALDPRDLQYLVLQEADAIDAVGEVQEFLRIHGQKPRVPFRNHQDTLDLAATAGAAIPEYRRKYRVEQSAADKRIGDRYRVIQDTQAKLRALDEELAVASQELQRAESNLSNSRQHDYTSSRDYYGTLRKIFTAVYYSFESAAESARQKVSGIKSRIQSLDKQPQDVFLPLPRNEASAIQWLFFLFMPAEFSNILVLAHQSQLGLWKLAPSAASPRQNIFSWFNSYKTTSDRTVTLENTMTLGSPSETRKSPLARGVNVRHYQKETGVFFPDAYTISPFWQGRDPFSRDYSKEDTARLFTENLPGYAQDKMQRFLVMLPTNVRGNEGIASKNHKPEWLTHEGYYMFSILRAFPNTQVRQLLAAMEQDQLPFEHECVVVLVKQLLFHIGQKEWKTDLLQGSGLQCLAAQLQEKAQILRESPNNTGKLLLFGVMSSYLGQFCKLCLDCSKQYTIIARSLADQVKSEVQNVEHVSPELYWKQARLYGCAILSHCLADNNKSSLLQLIELAVLHHNKVQFARQIPDSDELDGAVGCLLAKKIGSMVLAVSLNLNHLTRCLGLIVSGIPSQLEWSMIPASGAACFEAIGDNHHYSINVLNGTVLVDGVPPGFLPSSILRNPLYQRTFGSRNFECVVVGVAHYRTTRFVDDRFLYEFRQHQGELLIFELEWCAPSFPEGTECGPKERRWRPFGSESGQQGTIGIEHDTTSETEFSDTLLLLPKDSLDLPTLLMEPHSHWYSTAHDAIILREPNYKCRSVHYVVTREAIFRVPIEDISMSAMSIFNSLTNYDRLVISKPQAVQMLSRIENPKFILVWVDKEESVLNYCLPRLDLEFNQTQTTFPSINFSGFSLRGNQVLEEVLPGVHSYLVLLDSFGNEKVVIPPGPISEQGSVNVPDHWRFKGTCHIFDVHRRFGHLIAKDDVGRLQLAAIYAATACYILPNMDRAIELTRHCWTNEPLPQNVKAKLIEVAKYSNLSCSLRLMCSWIWICSNRMSFLIETVDGAGKAVLVPQLDMDPLAGREYLKNKIGSRLLPNEEWLLMGTRKASTCWDGSAEMPDSEEIQLFVDEVEQKLSGKLLVPKKTEGAVKPFPLDLPAAEGLEETINNDLLSSWQDYCSLGNTDVVANKDYCEGWLVKVKVMRKVLERELLNSLNHPDCTKHQLGILSGAVRQATVRDLLCIGTDGAKVKDINPFLSKDKFTKLGSRVTEWMILCVLEDKVQRMVDAQTSHALLVELKTIRKWSPWKHVRWLAFEVEQRLQIRPHQYSIVNQLLDAPGSMMQLNMGLGKTSVLVPMLILELMLSKKDVVRINMLSSIINVIKDNYRSLLTASSLHVKVFLLPFQRSFPLTDEHALIISEELSRCKDGSSFLLVTPQHRNSLLLKQYDEGTFVQGLKGPSFVDVIDESDAILDSSFQLVYALGKQQHLPDGETRWKMSESLLSIVSESVLPPIVALRNDVAATHVEVREPGAFPNLRLLAQSKDHARDVSRSLCQDLMANPPHEFLWMSKVTGRNAKLLVKVMSDREVEAGTIIESDPLFRDYKSDILAARGFIAYGLLFHCLRARHRVDYGVDKSRKKMAVPFFAADTPNPRADYCHPDVMIVYTCLSHYHGGLTMAQLKEAIVCLQKLGPSAQETIYNEWIDSISNGPTKPEDLRKFDSVTKVDIDNSLQLEVMFDALRHNMKLVSFWMNNFAFPDETHVFPGRRVSSAWNLVDNGRSVGFSGTDDNRFLLPLGVRQIKQIAAELRATNGEMIDRILNCTRGISLVDDSSRATWKVILEECTKLGTHALIDVGGLMAGVSNRDVALRLSGLLDHGRFRGVVYFDAAAEAWNIFQFKGKVHLPLKTSSLHEKDCFCYYDESRCRGSDLKLLTNACALVTLEPGLTKDSFLQGAARLRQLRPGAQSIILGGTSESLAPSSTAKDVLENTVKNTAKKNRKRIMELFDRGMDHSKFPEQIDMDVTLATLYSKALTKYESISAFFEATVQLEEGLTNEQHKLIEYCNKIGAGITVQATQLAEECERELENEEEEEEEAEVELTVARPYGEQDWNYARVFKSNSMPNFRLLEIRKLSTKLLGSVIGSVQWSDKLLCTANWRNTVQQMSSFYLRPVSFFLAYPDGKVVLISDYEADKLLPFWWVASSPLVKLGHLTLTDSKIWLGREEVSLPKDVLTSTKLFAGHVSFDDAEKKELKNIFTKPQPRRSILELLQLRHRIRFFDRSDLDVFSLTSV